MKTKNLPLIAFLFFITIQLSYSQEHLKEIHNENPDDEYIEVDKSLMPRQKGYKLRRSDIITSQVNVDANGMDIIGDAANEPSIAVDPTNPSRIVIGWRQFDTVTNNFRQAGYGYSLDGGFSWTFPGVIEPGVFRSDPVLDFDAQGNFYYNSLIVPVPNVYQCDVHQITDGGVSWVGPFPAFGGDKQWMRMDRSGGIGDQNNYSYWNSNFSDCAPNNFTRSTDGSFTFEDCILVNGDPFWGTLAVDKNGVLYVTGAGGGGIILIKSTNAQDPNATISWDFVTDVNLGGLLDAGSQVNPAGLMGQAWVDVDISDGAGEDNVYVLASVVPSGDPIDVMFAKSTDGGLTFEPAIRINTDDTGHYNWFGTMSVAPNGRIDVIWLDTRDDPNNRESRLYYSFSEDQGETWSNNEPLSPLFDSRIGWPQQNKMGDYFDMVSDNNYAHVAWTNTLNGGQDVYYSRIDPKNVIFSIEDNQKPFSSFSVLPNPSRDNVTLKFETIELQKVTITLYDLQGRVVDQILDKECIGEQQIPYTINKSLQSGIYFVKIQSGKFSETVKLIIA